MKTLLKCLRSMLLCDLITVSGSATKIFPWNGDVEYSRLEIAARITWTGLYCCPTFISAGSWSYGDWRPACVSRSEKDWCCADSNITHQKLIQICLKVLWGGVKLGDTFAWWFASWSNGGREGQQWARALHGTESSHNSFDLFNYNN